MTTLLPISFDGMPTAIRVRPFHRKCFPKMRNLGGKGSSQSERSTAPPSPLYITTTKREPSLLSLPIA